MSTLTETRLQTSVLRWFDMDRETVLREAQQNFQRRMQAERGGCSSEHAQVLAEEVWQKTQAIFHPTMGQADLCVQSLTPTEVSISGCIVSQVRWSDCLQVGAPLRLYCLSAGASGQALWKACDEDPVLAAAAHLMGSAIVHAAGRYYDAWVRATNPQGRWVKLALLAPDRQANQPCQWDPVVVRNLFAHFSDETSPIRISEAGSFDPVHTVLGLFRQSSAGIL